MHKGNHDFLGDVKPVTSPLTWRTDQQEVCSKQQTAWYQHPCEGWDQRRKWAQNGSIIFESRLREIYVFSRALDLWGRSLLVESYSEVKSASKETPETHLRPLCLKVSMLSSSRSSEFNSSLLSLSCLPCHVLLGCAAGKLKWSLFLVTQKCSTE